MFLAYSFSFATPVLVGDTVIEIPEPNGFTLITPDMTAVYKLRENMTVTQNEVLAAYISDKDVLIAREGKIPEMQRTCSVKVSKSIKDLTVPKSGFQTITNTIKTQNEKSIESAKNKMPEYFDKVSKNISEDFDINFAMSLSNVIPLPPHIETENLISYSMYLKAKFNVEGVEEDFIQAGTATLLHIKGKVLFLYFNVPKEDLKWSRDMSKKWSEAIIQQNPSHTNASKSSYSENQITSSSSPVDFNKSNSRTSELQAFLGGQKTKYSTEGHPKAKGTNISIEYPSNWQRSEEESPNIVQTFTSDTSNKNKFVQCMILIKDQSSFMALLPSKDISDAMFTPENLKGIIPEGATFIKGEQAKYDGQPGAWMTYKIQTERAGLRAEIYTLNHMFLYSGKLVTLQCGVAGLADSAATVENEFARYLPLFQLIGNSIVIHDKWTKPTNEGNGSVMENAFGEYWWITLIVSAIFTWGIGLVPPLLIRFAFLRRPISKGWAVATVILFAFINFMIFSVNAASRGGRIGGAFVLIAFASYAILRKGAKKTSAYKEPL